MNRLGLVFLVAVACGPIAPPCGPGPQADVDVTVASVTLGDQCSKTAAGASLWAGDCAPAESGGTCGLCRQSSVQLDIVSRDHSDATFKVLEVRLYDSSTGQLAATLSTSLPTSWNGSSYAQWDEVIPALTNLKTKYDLSTPDYASSSSRVGYTAPYKTQVDVEINGNRRTLDGPDAYREPEVAT
jgi:hypothetical protein